MSDIIRFGEIVPGYEIPVLNEREVRAAAGILFFFALLSFMNSWLMGNFRLTRIFVIAFLIDFTIRIFINPKYSPSMILGRIAVRKQVPEWAGAPQKRFAWAIASAFTARPSRRRGPPAASGRRCRPRSTPASGGMQTTSQILAAAGGQGSSGSASQSRVSQLVRAV
jgi:hypothetical protein